MIFRTLQEANYQYKVDVKDDESGVDFTKSETRDGDKTQGTYSILLPDTRVMTVQYIVDGQSGFVVEITYEGKIDIIKLK